MNKVLTNSLNFSCAPQRCIYTSPIKTLSNQKFRDFKNTFSDVGIITGDVSINPTATCLIMTTEVLRSMLFKGADLIRDVEWVVFDEVHYVNDAERGHVWEEVIIMLPPHVGLIMLSATVPNDFEFADWIGRTKKKKVYLLGTKKRPIPLEHNLYFKGALYKVVDKDGRFLAKNYSDASGDANKSKEKNAKKGGTSGHMQSRRELTEWSKLLDYLKKNNLLPTIVFAFSKRKCEEAASALESCDLSTAAEKSEVHIFMEKSFSRLTKADRKLPQLLRLKDMLKRGIGVHHAGLLPLAKEVVEMLFGRGLVKILFATETFAMGVNMPARCVVFNGTRKHDGRAWRDLHPGEYTQMSGRAGRRGLDPVGTVVIACGDSVPYEDSLKALMLGTPLRLESQFRLTYNVMLNLLRVEGFKVEDMIRRSFSEFASQKDNRDKKRRLTTGTSALDKMASIQCIHGEPAIEEYAQASDDVVRVTWDITDFILQTKAGYNTLCPGRVVLVSGRAQTASFRGISIAVVLSIDDRQTGQIGVLILDRGDSEGIECEEEGGEGIGGGQVPTQDGGSQLVASGSAPGGKGWHVVMLDFGELIHVTKSKISVDEGGILAGLETSIEAAVSHLVLVSEECGGNPEALPLVNPMRDLKINDLDFVGAYEQRKAVVEEMRANKCHKCPKLEQHFAVTDINRRLRISLEELKYSLSDDSLMLMPEFEARLSLLRSLGYIDAENVVQLKGHTACTINTASNSSFGELLVTELIYDGVLTPLDPAEAVALLSCFVCQVSSIYSKTLIPKPHQLSP